MSFHVPEGSRIVDSPAIAPWLLSTTEDGNNGAFWLESPEPGWRLFLIGSDGGGWEHVSVRAVSRTDKSRTPSWREMAFVKRICWDAEDVVVQYHPRESEYVNCHPNVLHLWRPIDQAIPTPPSIMVGPVSVGAAR